MRSHLRTTVLALMGLLTAALLHAQTGFGGMGGFGSVPVAPGTSVGDNSGASHVGLAPFVGITGNYSREMDQLPLLSLFGRTQSLGATATAGVYGSVIRPHSVFKLGYVGAGQYWQYQQPHISHNHVGSVQVAHQARPGLSLFASILAGSTMGGFGANSGFSGFGGFGGIASGLGGLAEYGLGGVNFGSLGQNGFVDNELLNLRTNFAGVSGGLSYRLSERWFATATGTTNYVDRRNSRTQAQATLASGSLGYRLTQRTSLQGTYSHNWMRYPSQFGGVKVQSAGLQYEQKVSSRLSLALFGGIFEIRSKFVGVVALDPEVAALLNVATSYQVQDVQLRSWAAGGSVYYVAPQYTFSANYSRGVSPGNGLLLASRRDSAAITYAYNGLGRWSVYAGFSVQRYGSVVGYQTTLTSIQASTGASRQLHQQLFFNGSLGLRSTEFGAHPRVLGAFASVGLFWSPRSIPIHF